MKKTVIILWKAFQAFLLADLVAPAFTFSSHAGHHGHSSPRHTTERRTSAAVNEKNNENDHEYQYDGNHVMTRRESIQSSLVASTLTFSFTCTSTANPRNANAYEPDPDPIKESLYLISRIQEATVQQERFVRKSTTQEALKSKMKLTLRLIEKNYKLVDQITFCSSYIPSEHLVEATIAGNEAAEELQSAIDYVNYELKTGIMTDDQRQFLISALSTTRESIFTFVDFMPGDKLSAARLRIEEENKLNIEEFDGDEDAGVYNPVTLPWYNRK